MCYRPVAAKDSFHISSSHSRDTWQSAGFRGDLFNIYWNAEIRIRTCWNICRLWPNVSLFMFEPAINSSSSDSLRGSGPQWWWRYWWLTDVRGADESVHLKGWTLWNKDITCNMYISPVSVLWQQNREENDSARQHQKRGLISISDSWKTPVVKIYSPWKVCRNKLCLVKKNGTGRKVEYAWRHGLVLIGLTVNPYQVWNSLAGWLVLVI